MQLLKKFLEWCCADSYTFNTEPCGLNFSFRERPDAFSIDFWKMLLQVEVEVKLRIYLRILRWT